MKNNTHTIKRGPSYFNYASRMIIQTRVGGCMVVWSSSNLKGFLKPLSHFFSPSRHLFSHLLRITRARHRHFCIICILVLKFVLKTPSLSIEHRELHIISTLFFYFGQVPPHRNKFGVKIKMWRDNLRAMNDKNKNTRKIK